MKKLISLLLSLIMLLSTMVIGGVTAFATSVSRSSAVNWANSKVGQSIDWDGVYGAQCVDLIAAYYNYLGTSTPGGNACNYVNNKLPSGWSRIKRDSNVIPEPGDIAVYDVGWRGNKYGHIAIVISANASDMTTVEQYGSTDHKTHKVNFPYNRGEKYHLWGFIKPNFSGNSSIGNMTTPTISVSRTYYYPGEKVSFSWAKTSANTDFYQYWVVVKNTATKQQIYGGASGKEKDVNANSLSFIANNEGAFCITVYSVPYNDKAKRQRVATKNIYVTKTGMTIPKIKLSKKHYSVGETVNFSWDKTSAYSDFYQYWLVIKNTTTNKQHYAGSTGSARNVNANSFNFKISESGNYSITVYSVPYTDKNNRQKYTTESFTTNGHDYDSVVTVQPTYTSEGVRKYTCNICKNSYTESIPKLQNNAKSIEFTAEDNNYYIENTYYDTNNIFKLKECPFKLGDSITVTYNDNSKEQYYYSRTVNDNVYFKTSAGVETNQIKYCINGSYSYYKNDFTIEISFMNQKCYQDYNLINKPQDVSPKSIAFSTPKYNEYYVEDLAYDPDTGVYLGVCPFKKGDSITVTYSDNTQQKFTFSRTLNGYTYFKSPSGVETDQIYYKTVSSQSDYQGDFKLEITFMNLKTYANYYLFWRDVDEDDGSEDDDVCDHIFEYEDVVKRATYKKKGKSEVYCDDCGIYLYSFTNPKIESAYLKNTEFVFNNKVHKPKPVVYDEYGSKLENGYDYTLKYSKGCKNPGVYTVKINYIGRYKGSEELYYYILPKATKVTKLKASKGAFTVKWKKLSSNCDGYYIMYSTKKDFSNADSIYIDGKNKTSAKINNLKRKKKYYVMVLTDCNGSVNTSNIKKTKTK